MKVGFPLVCLLALPLLAGCSSKPAAEVSRSELAATRKAHVALEHGAKESEVLAAFKPANKIKLGSSAVAGGTIEEWKVEAFHDEKNRKDLFVTFLYFFNDVYVDSSDSRIDFRNNQQLVDQRRKAAAPSAK